jgi:hypothetical protein
MNRSLPDNYRSYLLRMWRDNPQGTWLASLQSTATEQVYVFADLEQLWAFLKTQAASDGQETGAADRGSGSAE